MYYLPLYYLSGALFVAIWLVGFVAACDILAAVVGRHVSVVVTSNQLRKFIYWQIGVFLAAFVGFKWVVLTSYGDGYHVFTILSGHGSDGFAYPVAVLSLALVFYGGFRVLRFLLRVVHLVPASVSENVPM